MMAHFKWSTMLKIYHQIVCHLRLIFDSFVNTSQNCVASLVSHTKTRNSNDQWIIFLLIDWASMLCLSTMHAYFVGPHKCAMKWSITDDHDFSLYWNYCFHFILLFIFFSKHFLKINEKTFISIWKKKHVFSFKMARFIMKNNQKFRMKSLPIFIPLFAPSKSPSIPPLKILMYDKITNECTTCANRCSGSIFTNFAELWCGWIECDQRKHTEKDRNEFHLEMLSWIDWSFYTNFD